jgi:hypothetical protein
LKQDHCNKLTYKQFHLRQIKIQMNTDRLIKYLKNDLAELTEIFTELEPGSALSSLEIKMILNRINSVNEEFDLLNNELNNSSTTVESPKTNKAQPSPASVESIPTPKEPIPTENTVDIQKTETIVEQVEEKTENNIEEKVINTPKTVTEEDIYEEAPIEEDEEEEEEEVEEDVATNTISEEKTEEPIEERQQTIADKYQGSSNSLNEQIANLIEQKDLASKLQQNPIDDLTKAIKLNDKIWYSNELFEGNLDLYRETIRTINKMEELDEALNFLESNFQFDQEKKSFKSFIEMIYRRFLK